MTLQCKRTIHQYTGLHGRILQSGCEQKKSEANSDSVYGSFDMVFHGTGKTENKKQVMVAWAKAQLTTRAQEECMEQ